MMASESSRGLDTDRRDLRTKFTINLEHVENRNSLAQLPGDVTRRAVIGVQDKRNRVAIKPTAEILRSQGSVVLKLPQLELKNSKSRISHHSRVLSLRPSQKLETLSKNHSRTPSIVVGQDGSALHASFEESQHSADSRKMHLASALGDIDEISSINKYDGAGVSVLADKDAIGRKPIEPMSRSFDPSGDDGSSAHMLLMQNSKSNDREAAPSGQLKPKKAPLSSHYPNQGLKSQNN